jgi:hypothetical protein
MLREIPEARQIRGEPRRRWFNSASMDLYVWYDGEDRPLGLQLCYGKPDRERALTWFRPASYSHMAVDPTGQHGHSGTPILVADGLFDREDVNGAFAREGRELPADIRDLVVDTLGRYPGAPV